MSPNVVKDPIASAVLWNNPPAGAHIGPYNVNLKIELKDNDLWNAFIDPDGS